jgi:cell division cycle 14
MQLDWYNPATFNVADYQHYEKVENGDMNWIIPRKFLAFSTPVDDIHGMQDLSFSPDYYVPIFKKLNIGLVIRLNNKEYDREKFVKKGIRHLDIYFTDGTCPSDVSLRYLTPAGQNRKIPHRNRKGTRRRRRPLQGRIGEDGNADIAVCNEALQNPSDHHDCLDQDMSSWLCARTSTAIHS